MGILPMLGHGLEGRDTFGNARRIGTERERKSKLRWS